MSAKSIREFDGKRLLNKYLGSDNDAVVLSSQYKNRCVSITPLIFDSQVPDVTFDSIAREHPWLTQVPLVVKPDQLIKRRGKANLLLLNASWEEVQQWISERMSREVSVGPVKGILDHFLVEEFVPHKQEEEYYVCIHSIREGEEILFFDEGGVDVGDVDAKAIRLTIGIDETPSKSDIQNGLLQTVLEGKKASLAHFISNMLRVYRDLHFTYMEINPLVVREDGIFPLDMAAKLDETANFLCGSKWGDIEFPAPFGRAKFPEEAFVHDLDGKTGASLKLTILNHRGRIWTMVAGGGASVVYADTISDLGFGEELANYGEYSGAPNEMHTFQYAKTILDLMTREPDARGKILIIGGGIANFTDVALTFKGIIRAIEDYQDKLKETNVQIWVRRGGPNYQEGLRVMREAGEKTGVPMHVYGPETHITAIVPMALGLIPSKEEHDASLETTTRDSSDSFHRSHSRSMSPVRSQREQRGFSGEKKALSEQMESEANRTRTNATTQEGDMVEPSPVVVVQDHGIVRMTSDTRCIVYGLQQQAVQGMLDFDFLCKRRTPSVAAMIFPFSGNHYLKFYWGTNEVLIPVYQSIDDAVKKHPDVSVLINFSSFRSVYASTMDALRHSHVLRTHAIIAEGVPEAQTRRIIKEAATRNVGIIGPATVGGIKPGCLRIGNTGGMLDNILQSKLYRCGSVAYVSKSGGMSNELNNIICNTSDGVYEGVAIGGDKYPGSRFLDHLLRYEDNPDVKILVLLGEVGGTDEYDVCRVLKSGRITKPLVAWCIGTCAKMFPYEVQFGHAGACADSDLETALSKNRALAEAGAIVPTSFDQFNLAIEETYERLVAEGTIQEKPEMAVPTMPMDYAWAKSLGLIRKPANFISSITDDRGSELKYAGMPISEVFSEDLGVGGVLGLLWFKRKLPTYATKFIEMVLMVTADHGPAVSGAHNTIVTARAGKDLISSLVSGLLTIGPRFGGALDAAAESFSEASDSGTSPSDFVAKMRQNNQLIMGIGHLVKSSSNPDVRVTLIKEYALKHFPQNTVLEYALEVEKVTVKKKNNLILNVDGCVAACFVDLLRSCGAFTREEANEHFANGCLNGLFVLGRSIGFIGHFLDQKRLKQPLYRHPWDDISYLEESR